MAVAALALPAMAATKPCSQLSEFRDGEPLGTLHFKNGSLYGTGSGDEKSADGQAFQTDKQRRFWRETTLLTFDAAMAPRLLRTDPRSGRGLLRTTAYGDAYNGGNVYALSKKEENWASSTIWAFGGTNGRRHRCGSAISSWTNPAISFGTTFYGGTYNLGTVFELSNVSGVWTESVLHSFRGNGDGWFPYAGLLMAGWGRSTDHTIRR